MTWLAFSKPADPAVNIECLCHLKNLDWNHDDGELRGEDMHHMTANIL